MKISEITISYPCVRYEVEVKHFTARKSTAIEWVILEAVKKASSMPHYADISVGQLFREILLISDGNLLIRPCILQLQGLRALDAMDVSDETDLDTIPMRNLKLTDEGLKMQKDGLLPGAENDDRFSIVYLPHESRLIDKSVAGIKENPSGVVIGEEEDEPPFPSGLIKEYLENKRTGKHNRRNAFNWLLETTTIHDINPVESNVCWIDQRKQLNVGPGMRCVIDGVDDDDICTDALNKIEIPEASIFQEAPHVEVKDPDLEFKDIILPAELRRTVSEAVFRDEIYVIRESFAPNLDLSTQQFGKVNKKSKTVIVAGNTGFSYELVGKQSIFHVPDTVIPEDAVYIGKGGSVHIGKVTVYTKQSNRDLPIAFIPADEADELTTVCIQIVEKHFLQTPEVLMLLCALGEENMIDEYITRAIAEKHTISEKTDYIAELNKLSSEAYGKRIVSPDRLENILIDEEAIKQTCTDLKAVVDLLNEYRDVKLFQQNDDLFLSVMRKALPNVSPVESIHEIWDMWASLSGIKKSLITRVYRDGLAKPLYTEKIINEFLEMLNDDSIFSTDREYTVIESIILDMKRIILSTEPMLQPELSLDVMRSDEMVREAVLMHRDTISNLYNNVCNWQDIEKRFNDNIGDCNIYDIPGSYFNKIRKYMHDIEDSVSVFFNDKTKKYKQVFIIDTCALMHEPSVIEEFDDNKALLIIPRIVINELDGLKESQNEVEALSAREVIRKINAYETYEWLDLQEESHAELLPGDVDKQRPDNLILSIAIKYVVKQPIVITDDNNMRNSASSMSIKSMNLEGFHKSKQFSKEENKKSKKKKR